jgi:hypothetical protein
MPKPTVITQQLMSERYAMIRVVCSNCEAKTERVENDDSIPTCPRCYKRDTLIPLFTFKARQSFQRIDSLTPVEWLKVLPNMIDLFARIKKQPETAAYLTVRYLRLKRIFITQ